MFAISNDGENYVYFGKVDVRKRESRNYFLCCPRYDQIFIYNPLWSWLDEEFLV